MSVDAEVQKLIDVSLASRDVRLNGHDTALSALTAKVVDLAARVAALEAGTVPAPPPVTPPPAPGIPAIPAGTYVLRKDFADGTLAPFYAATFWDDAPHVVAGQLPGQMQSGQYMTQWCRYDKQTTDPTLLSVHNGYLDLGCKKRPDGSGFYDAACVTTGMPTPKFTAQYPKVRWCARFPGASGKADWRTLWTLIGDAWQAPEIDWPEIIGGKATAYLHGSSSDGQKASIAFDGNWHVWGVDVTTTQVTGLLDGNPMWTAAVAMTAKFALLADSKVGLATPDASTPADLRLHVAWVTVA